jgi:hypothetical protein
VTNGHFELAILSIEPSDARRPSPDAYYTNAKEWGGRRIHRRRVSGYPIADSRAKLVRITAEPMPPRGEPDMASREQRSNREKKKPKQDKSKKSAPAASPFAAPVQKGKPNPPPPANKK